MRTTTTLSLAVGGAAALAIAALGPACGSPEEQVFVAVPRDAGSGGTSGSLGSGDGAALPPDGGIDLTCATARSDAARVPAYMMIVLDASWSMRNDNPGGGGRWAAAQAAFGAIFDDLLAKADPALAVGFRIFGGAIDTPSAVNVDVGFVDAAQHQRMKTRILHTIPTETGFDEHGSASYTHTEVALAKAYERLRLYQPAAPIQQGGQRVAVLVTDGVPCGAGQPPNCTDTVPKSKLALEAVTEAAAAAGDRNVLTYSVGVGPFAANGHYDPAFLGAVAVAGGTRATPDCNPSETTNQGGICYLQITPPVSGAPTPAEIQALRDGFISAIDAVRRRVATCEFALTMTGVLDPSVVNVVFTSGATTPGGSGTPSEELIPSSPSDGWTYDDPASPKKIVLHGSSCTRVKGDPDSKVRVLIGCKTILR